MNLSEELQERVDIIQHKLKFIEQKPVVACIEQLDPLLFWYDTELLTISGAATSVPADWDSIAQLNPDVIILMLRDHTIEQTMSQIDQLLALPSFTDLKAIKNNRLYIADGSNYFFEVSDENKVDSVEILAEIINPKQFIFGYEDEAWVKFSL